MPESRSQTQAIGLLFEPCRSAQDGYELQQDLLRHLLEVEEHRNAFSKAVKRMRQGKSPQAGAPEPQAGMDPSDIEAWVLERELCERVARQFRSIGDALAWRAQLDLCVRVEAERPRRAAEAGCGEVGEEPLDARRPRPGGTPDGGALPHDLVDAARQQLAIAVHQAG
jgi:hypothetical protein